MHCLSIVEHTPFSTSILSPLDESTLYTVVSRRHPDGWWIDVVYRVEQDSTKSETHHVHTELATVLYIDAGTTRVRFGGDQEMESLGEQGVEVGLDAFLKRRKPYSNSRIFAGPDGMTYKWRIDRKGLELVNAATHALIARSHPRPSKISLPSSISNTVATGRTAHTLYPALSLHPALLALDSDSDAPQLLDAIVLTFFIMQRLLRERLRYRYP